MQFPRFAMIALGLFVCTASSRAIITRHDRDDSRYIALGARFPAVCNIGRAGEGTLIAPGWILSAAHVTKGSSSPAVTCEGKEYRIKAKFIFPNWQDMQPNDIGLIQLAEPVTEIEALDIYEATNEVSKVVVFVGRGGTGNGLTGPTHEDRKKRGATSRVENADHDWLYFTFHDPRSATDLEGVSGPGDSGGPALIENNGKYFVAGISVWGQPGKDGRGTYGAKEGYTRVSSYVKWIRDTMSGKSKPLAASP